MIILLSNLSTLVYDCIHYKSSKILFSVLFFSILRIDTKICDMIFQRIIHKIASPYHIFRLTMITLNQKFAKYVQRVNYKIQ